MTRRSLIERGMEQWRIVVTLVLVLVAAGLYSFFTMQRQEFGDFTIRQGLVIGVMPSATSEEVEYQLTRPVEDYLFSFNEIHKKKTYSVTKHGLLVVFVELNGSVNGLEAPAFWAKLRHGLNEQKARLPSQVVALIGNNDFGDTSALIFTVVAEQRSPRDLQKYVEVLQDHLRRIDATAKLRTLGNQEEVIRVSLSRERLARYGIRPATLWASLQAFSAVPAPGRLDGDELERPIHLRQVLRSEAALADTMLLALPTGQHVRLKDVAEIKREYGHDDAHVRFNGKTAMVLSIEMQSGNDITRFGDQVERALDATRRALPPDVIIARVVDQPLVVRTSVNHFLRDFGLAIAAVILATMLLLPFRVASVAAITIPICVAITLGVLDALRVKLETVSLAGLVIVLGMIVDNAIVVVDDHVDKLDRGLDPWTAAWTSARELTVPVVTATVAIILSYVPMPFFMTGTGKDFIGALPLTVAVALVTSLLVALFLVPVMNSVFIRHGLHREHGQRSILDRIQGVFDRALEAAFRHRWITLGAGLLAVVVALAIMGRLPQQTFPKLDRNQFAVEVYLPSGRSLKQTDAVMRRLERELLADQRVVNVTAFVGQSSPRFHMVYAPQFPARNYGQLVVNTINAEATEAVLRDSEQRLGNAFPEAWVRWKQLVLSIGNPVEVRLSGTEIADLKDAAAKIKAGVRRIPGTTWIRDDYEEPLQGIEIAPNADAAARLGVPPAMLQASLALGSQGFPIATIWEGDYPVKVLLQDPPGQLGGVEGLRQQSITSTLGGVSVPLEQLATVRPSWHEGAIVRRNGVRTLTVNVDLARGVLASVAQKEVERVVAGLSLPGVRVEYGGEKELSEEVMTPQVKSMVVSVGLIFLVLLVQFQRFRKAAVVMLAMPLSLLGAVLGLLLMRYPFGLTSFLGITGLFGIVVRNGIILVTYAEELRRTQGLTPREAGLAAGKRRMRPIYLTAMAAAIGVVPMILSRSTLWGPMGTVTFFGLLIAMVLTLFVLPVAYWTLGGHAQPAPRAATEPAPGRGPGAPAALVVLLALLLPAPAAADEGVYSLARCLELARTQSFDVQQARVELESAEAMRASVRTKYFPNVSLTAAGGFAADPLVKMKTQGGNLPVYDGNPANLLTATQFAYFPSSEMSFASRFFIFSATAMQPLYAGGRIVNANRLARLGVDAARLKVAMSGRDVAGTVEEKYWQIVMLEEKGRTLAAYEALLDALAKQVADAYRAGLLTRNDELKVAVKRQEAAIARLQVELGTRLATRDLRGYLGLPDGETMTLADALAPPLDPAPLAPQLKAGGPRRLELQLLAKVVEAEELKTSLKRGEHLPTVSIGASVLRMDIQGMPGQTNVIGFGMVTVPLSAWWEGHYAVKSQEKQAQLARRRLHEVRRLIGLEVTKRWDELTTAWRQVAVADLGITQAETNVVEVTDRHRSGLAPFSDVLEAQALRQQGLDRQLEVRKAYWLARSAFLRATAQPERQPAAAPAGAGTKEP